MPTRAQTLRTAAAGLAACSLAGTSLQSQADDIEWMATPGVQQFYGTYFDTDLGELIYIPNRPSPIDFNNDGLFDLYTFYYYGSFHYVTYPNAGGPTSPFSEVMSSNWTAQANGVDGSATGFDTLTDLYTAAKNYTPYQTSSAPTTLSSYAFNNFNQINYYGTVFSDRNNIQYVGYVQTIQSGSSGVLTYGILDAGYTRLSVLDPVPGDTNLDGDVDISDVLTAASQFTGPGDFGLTMNDGDTDEDGDIDLDDLQTQLAAFTGPNSAGGIRFSVNPAPGNAVISYDSGNGEVRVLTQDETLIGYTLVGSGFDSNDHNPLFQTVSTSTGNEVSSADPAGGALQGDFSLGPVLPAGLSEAQWQQEFEAFYVPSLGGGLREFQYTYESNTFGDTNGDDDIDMADLLTAYGRFTGPIGSAGGRAVPDGDADGDGDVDDTDLGIKFSTYTGPLAPGGSGVAATQGDVKLIYESSTGEIFIDTMGTTIIGYSIVADRLRPSEYAPAFEDPIPGIGFIESDDHAIGSLSIGAVGKSGLFNLGRVFSNVLREWQWLELVSETYYVPSMGGGLFSFELVYTRQPGDIDADGDVDDTDLGILISNFTGPILTGDGDKLAEEGDTDGDGDVDDTDLGVAISSFTGPIAPSTVPEPGSWAGLVAGAGLLLRRRRSA